MAATSGTHVALFKRFREIWMKLKKNVYPSGNNEIPDDVCFTLLGFIKYYLSMRK